MIPPATIFNFAPIARRLLLDSRQFKADPVLPTRNSAIPENQWRPIQIPDNNIDLAVIEQVTNCQTARHASLHQRGSRPVTGIAECAIHLVQQKTSGSL